MGAGTSLAALMTLSTVADVLRATWRPSFERQRWKCAGAKETAVRVKFDMSSTRYDQMLNAPIDQQVLGHS